MSEHITHVAICDDVSRLARVHPAVDEAFKSALEHHMDIARLGAVTRGADRFSAEFFAASRQHDARMLQHLAFALGTLAHRAADRLMKPIFRYFGHKSDRDGPCEASIYMDIFALREVLCTDEVRSELYRRAIYERVPGAFEDAFRVIWQRALIGLHTFAPDFSDPVGWLDRLLDTIQHYTVSLDRYARAAQEWAPDKVKRYIEETRFYNKDEPLIAAARALARGEKVQPALVVSALEATDDRSSRWARSLAKALRYILAAGRFRAGEIGLEEVKALFDVGVPENSLTYEPTREGAR